MYVRPIRMGPCCFTRHLLKSAWICATGVVPLASPFYAYLSAGSCLKSCRNPVRAPDGLASIPEIHSISADTAPFSYVASAAEVLAHQPVLAERAQDELEREYPGETKTDQR